MLRGMLRGMFCVICGTTRRGEYGKNENHSTHQTTTRLNSVDRYKPYRCGQLVVSSLRFVLQGAQSVCSYADFRFQSSRVSMRAEAPLVVISSVRSDLWRSKGVL